MTVIYVIAYTWQDTSLTIEHFFTPHKALKRLSEICDHQEKPLPTDDPEEYLSRYLSWVREENDNQCDYTVELEIITLKQ